MASARVLIKIGGRAFEGPDGFRELAEALRQAPAAEVLIVHGGGAEISQALKAAGRESVFVDGMRVTGAEEIAIVEEVLSGTVNRRIAEYLEAHGLRCRRLSGRSEGLLLAEPLRTRSGKEMGFVGRIVRVNPRPVAAALAAGEIPVVSPISADASGQSYNVNADSAAAALASAAGCTDLVFLTDVPGVMAGGVTQACLTVAQAQALIAEGTIRGGMVAKMESVFEALAGGVPRVYVIAWQGPPTLKRILASEAVAGTCFVADFPR